jgi:hypothetical protein
MRTIIRLSYVAVCVGALLAVATVAPAQTAFGGVAGGLYVHPTGGGVSRNADLSIGWRFSRRIEARVDWFTGTWGENYPGICEAVPYQLCYPAKSGWGLAASGVVNLIAPAHGPRAYLIGGVGHYHFNEYDEIAFGVSGGIGVTVPVWDRFRVVLETRYNHIVDGRPWLMDVMPVTLGIQF